MIKKILKQVNTKNIHAISGMDASFLYAETANSPMHIGSVSILEGSLEYEDFKKTIVSRLHLVPKLRQKLVKVPLSIDYPYWVDDEHFDIEMHLTRLALPAPGGWAELRRLSSKLFSEPLDNSRPLWSMVFIEGIDNIKQVPKGSVAVLSKMHHVMIDGMGGAGMLSLLYDFTPEVKEIPEPEPFLPNKTPNELAMVLRSSISFAKRPFKLPRLILETAKSTLRTGFLNRTQHIELPTAPFTSPMTPLNGIVSPRRKWDAALLDFNRVKKIKTIMETSLNDVVLAICSGALRRYLLEKDKLPSKSLVAMIPVSLSKEQNNANGGNQLSSMLVQLATDIDDPIERLETIHEKTTNGKTYQGAIGAKTLSNMAEAVPFGIANQAARLYSRFHISELHNPAFNVTITNVPGPQFPLYINGHKLLSIMGQAPVMDGMGLIITIFSYNGTLAIAPTSDANSMPDVRLFTKYIRESANEMENLALNIESAAKKKKEKPAPSKDAKSDVIFEYIRDYFKDNPKSIEGKEGVFQFHVNGTADRYWKFDLAKKSGTVRKGKAANPDVTFSISDDHLMRVSEGELDLQTSMVQGRLIVEGDAQKAVELSDILKEIPPMN